MSKNVKLQENAATEPTVDLLSMAVPVEAPKPLAVNDQPMQFSAGHNVAVDLGTPDRLVIVVGRGPYWDKLHVVQPGPKSKSKVPTEYLARTAPGSLYSSKLVNIDGRLCWLKVEITLVKDKTKAD